MLSFGSNLVKFKSMLSEILKVLLTKKQSFKISNKYRGVYTDQYDRFVKLKINNPFNLNFPKYYNILLEIFNLMTTLSDNNKQHTVVQRLIKTLIVL